MKIINWFFEKRGLQPTKTLRRKLVRYAAFLLVMLIVSIQLPRYRSGLLDFPEFTKAFWLSAGFWILILVPAISWVRFAVRYYLARQLDQDGVQTSGVITGRRVVNASYYTDFLISYSYLDDQQSEISVPPEHYHRARTGDQILVSYLPGDPDRSRLMLSSLPERKDERLAALQPTPISEDQGAQGGK